MDFQLFLKKIRTGWVTLMNVIKRSGEEVSFDAEKIIVAIRKANNATRNTKQITDDEITEIANQVIAQCNAIQRSISVEEIQDLVENQLMAAGAYTVAHNYITYRYERALVRKANTTDKKILSLLGNTNEEAKQENSNKNPTVNSTQRDYMAGEVSKDITRRFLLPGMHMKRASSTSMMQTTLHSRCITAVWSIWKTCCRMELSFPVQRSTNHTASQLHVISQHRSLHRLLPTSMAVRQSHSPISLHL